jgi:hypothetical protein
VIPLLGLGKLGPWHVIVAVVQEPCQQVVVYKFVVEIKRSLQLSATSKSPRKDLVNELLSLLRLPQLLL